jgi:DNA polymerase-3 subunit beta
MKISIAAARLGQALAPRSKKPPMLAHLVAADTVMSIAVCDGDIAMKATVRADVLEPGEVAVSADRLGSLVTAFAADATVLMTVNNGTVTISSGNGRYRLPIADVPAALAITGRAAEISLPTADLLTLFEPLPAAASEPTRFYLRGVYLHSIADRLFAVATNGVTLLRTSVATDTAFPAAIVPSGAITAMMRLVKQTRPERVTLRRDGAMLEAAAPAFTCTTRLIDATYPDYERVLPEPSTNVATCSRSDFSAALERLTATATNMPLIALTWVVGKPLHMFLAREPATGGDIIAADTKGTAQIALALPALASLVSEFDGERLHLEAAQDRALVIRAGVKIGVLIACRWNFREVEALCA